MKYKDNQIYYRFLQQNGKWITFLNAPGISLFRWKPILDFLAKKGYSLLLFDYPDHGKSSFNDCRNYAYADFAQVARLLLNKLRIKKTNIITTCNGSRVLLELLKSKPQNSCKIEKAICLNAYDNNKTIIGLIFQDFLTWLTYWTVVIKRKFFPRKRRIRDMHKILAKEFTEIGYYFEVLQTADFELTYKLHNTTPEFYDFDWKYTLFVYAKYDNYQKPEKNLFYKRIKNIYFANTNHLYIGINEKDFQVASSFIG